MAEDPGRRVVCFALVLEVGEADLRLEVGMWMGVGPVLTPVLTPEPDPGPDLHSAL